MYHNFYQSVSYTTAWIIYKIDTNLIACFITLRYAWRNWAFDILCHCVSNNKHLKETQLKWCVKNFRRDCKPLHYQLTNQKLTSLQRCTLWGTQTFHRRSSRHITLSTVALMISKAIVTQQCGPTIISSHSCNSVAKTMVEAQGCPGLDA
jgi:hypothetical protein